MVYLIIRHFDTADGERRLEVGESQEWGPGTARHKLQPKAGPGSEWGDAVRWGRPKDSTGEGGGRGPAKRGRARPELRAEAPERATRHQQLARSAPACPLGSSGTLA